MRPQFNIPVAVKLMDSCIIGAYMSFGKIPQPVPLVILGWSEHSLATTSWVFECQLNSARLQHIVLVQEEDRSGCISLAVK